MFLKIKNQITLTSLLTVIATLLLLQGCANHSQSAAAMERALNGELAKNQERFLNQSVSNVLAAFQRQPTRISVNEKSNDAVWLYDIYDYLIDPQTGKSVSRPGQLPVFKTKVHWRELYYANADGIVYDIKIEGERR